MSFSSKLFAHVALVAGIVGATLFAQDAQAGTLGSASDYNTPFGMTSAAQQNAPIDPSLRDQNGNLALVNGQFQSSAFAQGFAGSNAGASLANLGTGASTNVSGTGTAGSGVAFGGATAIGNSLNVVTVGNNNTVVVNSTQTNKGNVTATTSLNGN